MRFESNINYLGATVTNTNNFSRRLGKQGKVTMQNKKSVHVDYGDFGQWYAIGREQQLSIQMPMPVQQEMELTDPLDEAGNFYVYDMWSGKIVDTAKTQRLAEFKASQLTARGKCEYYVLKHVASSSPQDAVVITRK